MSKNVIEKIINNWIEYYFPDESGGGWDLDIWAVNALIDMKLWDYDSLFSVTNGLYKILNSIDTEDEIWLTWWDTWNEIVADDTSMSLISHCYAVMCYIANSYKAMSTILADASATDEISECWNSISIIAECELAANLYLASVNGITSLFKYNTAQDAFFTSTARKTQIITQNIMVIVNDDTLLASLIDDPIVKSVICNSQNALNTIAWDSDKLDIVENDTTIMNTIANNSWALWHMSDSDFFEYILENETYLATCAAWTNWKAKINSYAADDLLDPIYFWTGDLGYSTFAELAADDTSMEIVQANTQAMLIVNNNEEADSYMFNPAYKKVEYIQSSSSWSSEWTNWQRIATWITPTNTTKIEMKISNFTQNGSFAIFGSDQSWWTRWFTSISRSCEFWSTYSFDDWTWSTRVICDWWTHIVELSQSWYIVDWVNKVTPSSVSFTWVELQLFCMNRNWTMREYSWYRLYYCKIWSNWNLVREFIPCYRKSDNVIWLYDKVNDVFYTNKGYNSFTKWPDA